MRRTTILAGERVVLRPGTRSDVDALVPILSEPSVARWWGTPEPVAATARKLEGDDATTLLVVEVGGEVAGGIEYWEEDDPDYRHAGIDVYLSERWQGRGLGTEAVRLLARFLFEERRHHRLTIDPAADNERAIRCYERAGFRPVGVMRRYERRAGGAWHDGLLMDMLPEDLVREPQSR